MVRQYVYTRKHVQEKETRNDVKQGLVTVCSTRMLASFERSPFLGCHRDSQGGLNHLQPIAPRLRTRPASPK